ncbi:MarR family transcriptional regulator [Campylobacter sp. faydin G-105]|uniref:MarR family winged helix-turn-helix transcriptional regulator n=1 Tax=Campylobacter anatolicus TaxID=2829105 RepID=UPI001B983A84|nr:MarR family transcriptional regulator [Campylobacter anatolicus]MBR8461600.1 MarR family transcriptional regulator [Campylobacter anatolicus]
MKIDDKLRLKNQLCFPLYVASKEITKLYRPFLDEIDLTYTQYIAMMVLWERGQMSVKELGEMLYLDSGTLTPLLKKLEEKGFIERNRASDDERNVIISLTKDGKNLHDKAALVPDKMSACVCYDEKNAKQLYELLYGLIGKISPSHKR